MVTQWTPRHTRRDLRGEWSLLLPLEAMPDSPGESGCEPEIPVAPGEKHWVLDTSLDEVSFFLQ